MSMIKTYDRHVDAREVLAQVRIPKDLGEAFEANPAMKQRLVPTILKAVTDSLQDPRTSPAILTDSEMRRRCDLAAEALREIYFDRSSGLSLHRALDLLDEVLINYLLLEGGNIAQVACEAREHTDQEQDDTVGPSSDARWGVTVEERVPRHELEVGPDEVPADLNEEIDEEQGKPDWVEFEKKDDRIAGR